MIYLDEADLIARLFIQEIKINTSFRFPSIKLEFNRIDTLRKHWESRGKRSKILFGMGEGRIGPPFKETASQNGGRY